MSCSVDRNAKAEGSRGSQALNCILALVIYLVIYLVNDPGYLLRFVTFLLVFFSRHLSSVLGNKFDHGAEAIMPTIFNLIPNSAKVMATSGVVAVRLIIRVSVSRQQV